MSKIDRAAKIIDRAMLTPKSMAPEARPLAAAEALDLAGLLAPIDQAEVIGGMLAMLDGMREEYAVQVRRAGRWQWSRDEDDFRWQDRAVQMVRADRDHPGEETRLVRRYVTEPEEA